MRTDNLCSNDTSNYLAPWFFCNKFAFTSDYFSDKIYFVPNFEKKYGNIPVSACSGSPPLCSTFFSYYMKGI